MSVELFVVCVVLGTVIGFAAIFWAVEHHGRRRMRALAMVAQEMNMSFSERVATTELAPFSNLPSFQAGGVAENQMKGKYGKRDVVLMDYRVAMTDVFALMRMAPVSSTVYDQTVVIFPNAVHDMPDFHLLAKESWWSKPSFKTKRDEVEELLIGTENEQFVTSYKVSGSSTTATHDLFTEDKIDFFACHKGWDVEVADGHFLVYQVKRRQPPHKWPEFLEQAVEILKHFQNG